MPLIPLLDMRNLGRFFSRDLPEDQIRRANKQLQYARENDLVKKHEEPALALELAPRKIRNALRKIDRLRATDGDGDGAQPSDRLTQPRGSLPIEAAKKPAQLPRGVDDGESDPNLDEDGEVSGKLDG